MRSATKRSWQSITRTLVSISLSISAMPLPFAQPVIPLMCRIVITDELFAVMVRECDAFAELPFEHGVITAIGDDHPAHTAGLCPYGLNVRLGEHDGTLGRQPAHGVSMRAIRKEQRDGKFIARSVD